ncbi:hypothetical protein Misp02_22070 [Microtetraspora sp. NBRC 16547]|nr:hypothetical protein Misp02_22070 [Microtetraspora sp. NBRC 16547]
MLGLARPAWLRLPDEENAPRSASSYIQLSWKKREGASSPEGIPRRTASYGPKCSTAWPSYARPGGESKLAPWS